jgi:hypothetical protein
MLFSSFCGFNLNLIKAGLAVGCIDFFSILYDVFLNFDAFKERESEAVKKYGQIF